MFFKTKDTRIKSNFWDVAPMICCKMVRTSGVDSSANALCCLRSQRRQTGRSTMANIQREDWQQRRGEQEQRWNRQGFLGWQAFWQQWLRGEKKDEESVEAQDGGEKTAKCTKSSGDSSDSSMSRQEGETRRGMMQGVVWETAGLWWVEEMWMGQPGWLQATRWFGGNTCCSARRGGSSGRDGPSTSSASGEKGDSRRGVHLFSLSVPSSFSQPVCGSLRRRLLLPSAAGQNVSETKSKKKNPNLMDETQSNTLKTF